MTAKAGSKRCARPHPDCRRKDKGIHRHGPAIDREAVAQTVRQLAVDERGLAVDQPHAVALTVVHRDLLEPQLFNVHVAAVAHDTVLTAMNVGIRQPVLKGGTIEMQALPLPADTVVGQIIEHSVQATATQHHFLARCSAYDQPPVHVYSGSMVEIERRTGFDGQRGPFVHFDSP